jgi:hypothetical protein
VCEDDLCVPDRDESGTGGRGEPNLGGMGGDVPGSGGTPAPGSGGEETQGGAPTVDEEPPRVVSRSPSGALIDGRSPIVVTFSEAIEASEADIRVVLDTAINISGDVEVEEERLIFRPAQPLASSGNYVVEVGRGVTDLSGNALSRKYTFDFTSYEVGRVADESVRLDGLTSFDVSCPHLKMDAQGNAMVLFAQGGALFTAYYTAGDGWGPTQEVAQASHGVLGMSPGGQAAIAYQARVAGEDQILVRMTDGPGQSSFGNPILAGTGSERPMAVGDECSLTNQGIGIAVNDAGSVVVSWRGEQATSGDPSPGLVTAVKPAGAGFGMLSFTQTYYVETFKERPAVAIDSIGNVQLVFDTWNVDAVIRRRSYDAASASWSNPVDVGLSDAQAVAAGVDSEDFFLTAYPTFEYPDQDRFVHVDYATFEDARVRGGEHVAVAAAGAYSSFYLSDQNVPWVTWKQGDSIGSSGYVKTNDRFDGAHAVVDANASFPVIVGVDGAPGSETQGLLLFPSNGDLRWTVSNLDPYNGGGAVVVKTMDFGGALASEARLAYDMGGKHGIVVWTRSDSETTELYATSFHRLPEAAP